MLLDFVTNHTPIGTLKSFAQWNEEEFLNVQLIQDKTIKHKTKISFNRPG